MEILTLKYNRRTTGVDVGGDKESDVDNASNTSNSGPMQICKFK